MIPLNTLKDKHKGEDIYVLGSGYSLNFFKQSFFQNKTVVCVNHTIEWIEKAKTLYLVAKEANDTMQKAAYDKNATIVTCKHKYGDSKCPLNPVIYPDITSFFDPVYGVINQVDSGDKLERSSSTMVTALHFAALLGSHTILLIGHDCGLVDNKLHVDNYNKTVSVNKTRSDYCKWMVNRCVEKKTIEAKQILKEVHNIDIHSINPFINFNLEGHIYTHFK